MRLVLGAKSGKHLNRTVGPEFRIREQVVGCESARYAPAPEASPCLIRDPGRMAALKCVGAEPIRQPAPLPLVQGIVDEQLAGAAAA